MLENDLQIENKDRNPTSTFHPLVLVLDNIRSAYNVGNIFRLAEICRVESIITCGYTVTPPHSKLTKTARGCETLVPCENYGSCNDAIDILRQRGFQVVGIETIIGAKNVWDINFRFPTAFIFGNEATGLSQQTLNHCDIYARLPVFGYKNSLNVSNCAAVVTYAAVQQLLNR